MTVVQTRLTKDLEQALEPYRKTHALTDEVVIQKALKRFLLEEGCPAEDEPLAEVGLEALRSQKNADYDSWEDVKNSLYPKQSSYYESAAKLVQGGCFVATQAST